jgi:hypothetical protein
MVGRYVFQLRPTLDWTVKKIGREGTKIIVIDGILQNPVELIDYAELEVNFDRLDDGSGGYPGVRAAAPLNYVGALVRAVDPLIQRVFGLENVSLGHAECTLSMVNTPRDLLHPRQCIPHIDTTDQLQFALLHFLCGEDFGGTAFFRQNATGYERIDAGREVQFDHAMQAALRRLERRRDYIGADDPDYTRINVFDAAFDRLLIYPSSILHSGVIHSDSPLCNEPRNGRLTSNIFLNYRQNNDLRGHLP